MLKVSERAKKNEGGGEGIHPVMNKSEVWSGSALQKQTKEGLVSDGVGCSSHFVV